jgi:DNA modification methylase
MIDGAVQVSGSDSSEFKEKTLSDFSSGKIRVIVSKPSICGFGMNWQHCANMAFVGVDHSYESFYQAVRRSWRFGQTREVSAHVFYATTEGDVVRNLRRKEQDAAILSKEMVYSMSEFNTTNTDNTRKRDDYERITVSGTGWDMHRGDCIDIMRDMPSNSIHYSIFSPPFASLYTYSNSERDMGNCKTDDEFATQFRFMVAELYRILKDGRLVSFHCMNLPTSKERDGYIGIRDFRGLLIKIFEEAGFIYHSEVVIWKDPVTAMQRTKALGLLHKTIRKDSAMSRQGIPDYLVTMRKPGDNDEPISHTHEDFPVSLWQRYASPVWMDINPSKTLQHQSAREEKDERHICPLQLQVIERGIQLWSNPGDTVFSPFSGIGSEGYVSLVQGRKFVGAELKASYFEQACKNLAVAVTESGQARLFD